MKNKFSVLLSFIPPATVFVLVYLYTDRLFQVKKFPYPFELFGVAAGLGSACWVYAIIKMFQKMKRRNPHA